MKPAAEPELESESLECLLLDMAQERSLHALLKLTVNRLAPMALVRIWVVGPGHICASCRMQAVCPDQTYSPQLVVRPSNPLVESGADWSRLDSEH